MKTALLSTTLLALTWSGLWFTPDQQGRRLFERGDFARAAESFHDPMWQGIAWYRAGEFENAANAFARRQTPEAYFNQGNAWVFRGKYDAAMAAYDRALEILPDWKEARENRELAARRAEMTRAEGGDLGDQKLGADEIVFDEGKENQGGQDTEVTAEQAVSEEEVQALWLRRVQTRPADFLKVKFSYQFQVQGKGGAKSEP
ncbi:MAG: tetratricopeptide repeat protein [Verrucomicrobiae bacterium]|nr:tetratricopeptide repeat protein [Verrucomicrobiae bacterium]